MQLVFFGETITLGIRYLVTVISTEPGGHCTGRGHSSARVGGLRTVGYQLF